MKLPLIDKNAYLSLFVSSEGISANLVFADYVSGRHYTLSDYTDLRSNREIVYSETFWQEYFNQIEKAFNWDILRGTSMMRPSGEGVGVSGITVNIKEKGLKSSEIISHIREVSHDITYSVVSDEFVGNILSSISNKRGYDDILYINLDLFGTNISRFLKSGNRKTLAFPRSRNDIKTASVVWNETKNLIESIRSVKFKAFLATPSSFSKLENQWANCVLAPSLKTSSNILSDVIRSYITLSLLTILNENGNKFMDFGVSGAKTLLIVSGDLLDMLPLKSLLIGVLDGLEARGNIDMVIDRGNRLMSFGKNYSDDLDAKYFAIGISDIFDENYKILIPDVTGKKGERRIIFSGTKMVDEKAQEEVFALSSGVTIFHLDNKNAFISGKLLKNTYLYKKENSVSVKSDVNDMTYSALIIDGRYKPIIYGPDARTNALKISNWLDETD